MLYGLRREKSGKEVIARDRYEENPYSIFFFGGYPATFVLAFDEEYVYFAFWFLMIMYKSFVNCKLILHFFGNQFWQMKVLTMNMIDGSFWSCSHL